MIKNFVNVVSQIDIDPNDIDLNKTTPDDNTISNIMQIVFGLAGVIAVLIIVIAGVMFILSRGDPQKSSTARNAIIYAAVGLAISVAAFSIVGFVAEGL